MIKLLKNNYNTAPEWLIASHYNPTSCKLCNHIYLTKSVKNPLTGSLPHTLFMLTQYIHAQVITLCLCACMCVRRGSEGCVMAQIAKPRSSAQTGLETFFFLICFKEILYSLRVHTS